MKPLFRDRMKSKTGGSSVTERPSKKKSTAAKSLYSVHPSIAYAQSILDNLAKTTGKAIEEWTRLIKKTGPTNDKACFEWLKKEHKLGGTTAWMVAQKAFGKTSEDT